MSRTQTSRANPLASAIAAALLCAIALMAWSAPHARRSIAQLFQQSREERVHEVAVPAVAIQRAIRTDDGVAVILRNEGNSPCQLRGIVLAANGENRVDYLSTSELAPQGNCLLRFKAVEQVLPESTLQFQAAVRGGTFQQVSLPIPELDHGMGAQVISLDRSTGDFFVCLDEGFPNGSAMPQIAIDGIGTQIRQYSILREPGEKSKLLISGKSATVPREWTSRIVEMTIAGCADGVRIAVAPLASLKPCFQQSQYEYPVRLTRIEGSPESDCTMLTLYNEASFEKLEAIVHEIQVDGQSTVVSSLPTILKPDMHDYLKDEKRFELRELFRERNEHEITVTYSQIPKQSDRSGDEPAKRSFVVPVKRGLRWPIGTADSPTIEGCVCVWHGGLRPKPDQFSELCQDITESKTAAPTVPTYFRAEECQDAGELSKVANACDFIEIADRTDARRRGLDSCSSSLSYLESVRDLRTPFVFSINSEAGFDLSGEERTWRAIAALSRGAQGIRFPEISPSEAERPLWKSIAKIVPLMNKSYSLPYQSISSLPGISTHAVAISPRLIAVFVLNEWASWSTRAISENASYNRGEIDVHLNFKPEWEEIRVASVNGNVGLVESNGGVEIALEDLDIGTIVFLFDGEASAEVKGIIGDPQPGRAGNRIGSSHLQLLHTPFCSLGRVFRNQSADISIPIRNSSDERVIVECCPVEGENENAVDVTAEPTVIDARSESSFIVHVKAPRRLGKSLTCVAVRDSEKREVANLVFDADCIEEFVASPDEIDCGNYFLPKEMLIRVTSNGRKFAIKTASCKNPAIRVVANSSDSVVTFTPPAMPGLFSETILIDLEISDGTLIPVQVPIRGICRSKLEVSPSEIHLFDVHGQAVVRKLSVRSAGKELRVAAEVSKNDAIKIRTITNVSANKVEVAFSADCDLLRDEAGYVNLVCNSDGIESTVNVPVKSVSKVARDDPAKVATPIDTLKADVRKVARRLQRIQLPDGTPNWIVIHQLLMFSGVPQSDEIFKAVLQRAIIDNPHPIGAFVFTRGRPIGQMGGTLFDHQHHPDQFLEYFAACGLPSDTQVRVQKKMVAISDLMKGSYFHYSSDQQLPWTAAAYATYCQSPEWENKFAEKCRYADLCRNLISAKDKTCGGSHWYFSLSFVRNSDGPPGAAGLSKIRAEADEILHEEIRRLKATRLKSGALRLPEEFTIVPETKGEVIPHITNIHYSGHSLEWIVRVLTPDELREQWVVDLVRYLVSAIETDFAAEDAILPFSTEDRGMNFGFLSHAIAGLKFWEHRTSQ